VGLWEYVPLKFDIRKYAADRRSIPEMSGPAKTGQGPSNTGMKGLWNRLFTR
jgi:hypothetical protein